MTLPQAKTAAAADPGGAPAGPAVANREAWLTELARHAEPVFRGFTVAPYRVTCGWPARQALGRRARRLGECHAPESSPAGLHEIFISPLIDNPVEVAGTVCHELAHVVAGIAAGHRGQYRVVCKHAGLTKGRPVQAMPGPALEDALKKIIDTRLGPYPHRAMTPALKAARPAASVTVRCCACGCLARLSVDWAERAGLPTCGCGGEMALKLT